MKMTVLIKIVCIVLVVACRNGGSLQPSIQLPLHELAVGRIPGDTTIELVFPVKNAGAAELVVDTVSTSCDCTVPGEPHFRVAPGSVHYLRVSFHPVDTGFFRKNIVLKANTDSVFHVLRFHGYAAHNNG